MNFIYYELWETVTSYILFFFTHFSDQDLRFVLYRFDVTIFSVFFFYVFLFVLFLSHEIFECLFWKQVIRITIVCRFCSFWKNLFSFRESFAVSSVTCRRIQLCVWVIQVTLSPLLISSKSFTLQKLFFFFFENCALVHLHLWNLRKSCVIVCYNFLLTVVALLSRSTTQ